jgi:cytochrome P450
MMDQEPKNRLYKELNDKIFEPYKNANGSSQIYDVRKIFDYENVQDLKYFSMCFNESLRIEPPVVTSGNAVLLEDLKLGKFEFLKGDKFQVFIH